MNYRKELNQLVIVANNTLKHKDKPVTLQLDKAYDGINIVTY